MARRRSIIGHHLILTMYGHWLPNDPRGSGSHELLDEKFEPLGPIHHGRQPEHLQPARDELREFQQRAESLLNFSIIWLDDAKRTLVAEVLGGVIGEHGYTCWACAVLSNHAHLVIRVHRDDALTMWNHFAEGVRERLCLRIVKPDDGKIQQ